jgi:glycosyltransferase involved in cell wall biosynthesis
MRIAIVVPFLNEERYLPRFLESLAAQRRPADRVILVDDGSVDRSQELCSAFAADHDAVELVTHPAVADQRNRDRLGAASELRAFQWAIDRLDDRYDVVAKLDADLQLTPAVVQEVERQLAADERLGITGPYLSVRRADGRLVRERCPPYHVRGATKFYRQTCLAQMGPPPPILGWDTIDEVAARRLGWRTGSFAMADGDPVHLRPTGAVDGRLRGYRRWGACAYAIGDHPLWLALAAARRATEPPWVLGGAAYLWGWAAAWVRRAPRAAAPIRRQARREQLARLRDGVLRRGREAG